MKSLRLSAEFPFFSGNKPTANIYEAMGMKMERGGNKESKKNKWLFIKAEDEKVSGEAEH